MNLMLLCAGEGTRLRPHTLVLPKPAVPFLTVPMAAYGLEWAKEIAPDRLIVNTYHLPGKIHDLFHAVAPKADLRFSDEAPTLMGSGGGIMKARKLIDGDDFLAMNGDEIFLPSRDGQLREARERHVGSRALATLVVMKYPGVGSVFGGVWADGDGRVRGFGKTPIEGATAGWHYIGAIFLSRRVFDYLPPEGPSNLLYDALAAAIAKGESVRVAPVEGWWHETGNEADYLKATGESLAFLGGTFTGQKSFLEAVLRARSPKAVFEKTPHGALLSFDGLPLSAEIEGFAVLGRGAKLAAGTKNKNAVLGDGVRATEATIGLKLAQ